MGLDITLKIITIKYQEEGEKSLIPTHLILAWGLCCRFHKQEHFCVWKYIHSGGTLYLLYKDTHSNPRVIIILNLIVKVVFTGFTELSQVGAIGHLQLICTNIRTPLFPNLTSLLATPLNSNRSSDL